MEIIRYDRQEARVWTFRGQRVMLSTDLARLYAVPVKVLVQAVKRNLGRFPADFMFRLTLKQAHSLRSQFVTLKRGKHVKHPPYAFTEQGVAMLSSVLGSGRAVEVNIAIMRAFVRFRETIVNRRKLELALKQLEQRVGSHDEDIQGIIQTLRALTHAPKRRGRRIGFIR
ncbi:MAG: ORF6N domain-containing protein [Elusimicrobia bacterium]|nr:ORF6N domain-containing protein [Elusimicrobiota bacterium]